MGLEALEMVLAVENRFRIVLLDEEVGRMETIGDLARLVHELQPLPETTGG